MTELHRLLSLAEVDYDGVAPKGKILISTEQGYVRIEAVGRNGKHIIDNLAKSVLR